MKRRTDMTASARMASRPAPGLADAAGGSRRAERGFTLVEILIGVVISAIVMTAIYGLLVSQFRTYSKVRERADVHVSLRAAAALLAWELRTASGAEGDLYAVGATSVTLRSVDGTGVVCVVDPAQAAFGLVATDGELVGGAPDSALVFSPAGSALADDEWKAVGIAAVGSPGGSTADCAWTGTPPAEVELRVAVTAPADTAGIAVGSPVRAFRAVEYGLFEQDGRSWLGRRVAGGDWEAITGPLEADDGVDFIYYDGNGNPTADPLQVAAVRVTLRAESDFAGGPGRGFERDSLSLRVALRN